MAIDQGYENIQALAQAAKVPSVQDAGEISVQDAYEQEMRKQSEYQYNNSRWADDIN